jgi:hypothetical protein
MLHIQHQPFPSPPGSHLEKLQPQLGRLGCGYARPVDPSNTPSDDSLASGGQDPPVQSCRSFGPDPTTFFETVVELKRASLESGERQELYLSQTGSPALIALHAYSTLEFSHAFIYTYARGSRPA